MKIPFLDFQYMHKPLRAKMISTFEEVYDNSWFVLGERVAKFEEEYARFNDTDYCLGVSNGLDALHLSLSVLGIGKGDEVIVPSNTYIASVMAISHVGATPVLVEPRITTYNIDSSLIENAITSKTKAIMPVHLYGQACEMEAINSIANKHNLFIIEDNAQAQGARFNGKLTGSFGQINATSYYPGKNIGALGDAGAITTNDKTLFNKAKVLRNYGSSIKYVNEEIGFNMRLDELQAAFLLLKLDLVADWTEERNQIARWYYEDLKDIDQLILPETHPLATHVYHLFVVRCNDRDGLQSYLSQKEIGTLIHYPIPPHLQKAYNHLGFRKGDFPIAEELAETCLSLPMYPGLKREQVQYIAESIKKYFKRSIY